MRGGNSRKVLLPESLGGYVGHVRPHGEENDREFVEQSPQEFRIHGRGVVAQVPQVLHKDRVESLCAWVGVCRCVWVWAGVAGSACGSTRAIGRAKRQ